MYDYKELREKALNENATVEDRVALYEWLEQYDMRSWNGECFDIGEGLSLYPVYNITDDEVELIDAEIK
jgi:hypothetical protein